MHSVSFIVPSYQSFRTIERTIQSLATQTRQDAIREILLVDSSDDLKTRSVIQSLHHPKLQIIESPERMIPSQARNLGALKASGDLLCFIDSDVCLDPEWLDRVLSACDAGVRAGAGSVSIPVSQSENPMALAQWYLQFNETLEAGDQRVVAMVPACNFFISRELFQKSGGFPDMRASEDTLFCLNVGKLAPIWFVPQARSYHIFRESSEDYFKNQIVLGKYILVYRRNFYGHWWYRGLFPLLLLPVFLVIKWTRIVVRIANAGPNHLRLFFKSLPFFMKGFCYWTWGFASACFESEHNQIQTKAAS